VDFCGLPAICLIQKERNCKQQALFTQPFSASFDQSEQRLTRRESGDHGLHQSDFWKILHMFFLDVKHIVLSSTREEFQKQGPSVACGNGPCGRTFFVA